MQYLKIAAVSFLAVLSMASCKQNAEGQKEAVTYPLLKVSPEDRTLSVSYSAVIEGKQDVEVRPQVSGFITDVLVKEGAKVKKGQTLFVIDTIPYAASYRQAKAAVATAEASSLQPSSHWKEARTCTPRMSFRISSSRRPATPTTVR